MHPNPTDQLTTRQAAALAGIQQSTFEAYLSRGEAGVPPPDGHLGRTKWWYRHTITSWIAYRNQRAHRAAKASADRGVA